jgi:hypothetical protein
MSLPFSDILPLISKGSDRTIPYGSSHGDHYAQFFGEFRFDFLEFHVNLEQPVDLIVGFHLPDFLDIFLDQPGNDPVFQADDVLED